MRDKIANKIVAILESKGFTDATESSKFIDDLGMDSLDTVEIVMEVEKEFRLSIPDELMETTETVGQLADYIEAKIGHKK